jgi:Glycosyl transferase family 2
MSDAGSRPAVSIVVPVHDEEGNVAPLHAELGATARGLGVPYEIVFVNDGSRDRTLERLSALAARDPHLRIVDLDRNVGEAGALSAGFAHARGAVIVTLDGDGQNDPAAIPRLLDALDHDVDVVSGWRMRREEPFLTRVLPSRVANALIALASGVPVHDCGCGLKAYRREVVAGAQLPRGMNRFLPAILGVEPSRVREVAVVDRPRGSGASHYGLWRVLVVLRDLLALPLLVRGPAVGPVVRRRLGVAAGLLAVAAVGTILVGRMRIPAVLVASGAGLGAAAAAAVRYNVDRMLRAREAGVFRVGRVTHGTDSQHRDRRRGVLGQEPAPHLPSSAGDARH